jgi:hypothetical protein
MYRRFMRIVFLAAAIVLPIVVWSALPALAEDDRGKQNPKRSAESKDVVTSNVATKRQQSNSRRRFVLVRKHDSGCPWAPNPPGD